MKKLLFSFCVTMLSCVAFAQTNVVVVLKNGTEVKYVAADVDSIRIEKVTSEEEQITVVPFEETGLRFDFFDSTATVKARQKPSITEVKIPSRVLYDGKEYVVTEIGEGAFAGSHITSIEIPESVTEIGEGAFYNCDFTSIEIPNSVTIIEKQVFWNCANLKSIVVGNSVTEIKYMAFYGCESLTSIEIPESLTTIGQSAFESCKSLTSVEFPFSVTVIGKEAFASCTSLKIVYVPRGCKIGDYAFPYSCDIIRY